MPEHQTDNALNPTGLDAYKPAEIANLVERAGTLKVKLPFVQLFALAVLAGAFIALGAMFYIQVMTGADAGAGPVRFLGGIAFSLGLILVIVGGAELFTGNGLMVMAWVDRQVTTKALLYNWLVVYLGNLIGAGLMVALAAMAGLVDGAAGATVARIAQAKLALDPGQALVRGVLCNVLVCLAVWLSFAARSVSGKILAIVWPISAFVALGLEHSIANMYLLPAGMLAGAGGSPGAALSNLFFVTIGNILGGAGGVSLAYWTAYGRYRPDTR
jgi:formate/nitrite transporter